MIQVRRFFLIGCFFINCTIPIYANSNAPLFLHQINQLSSRHSSPHFQKATLFFLQENWDSTLIYSMQQLHQSSNKTLVPYCHYFRGVSFWSRGYCVSTTGYDEGIIQNYIRNQEEQDKKVDQLSMIFD